MKKFLVVYSTSDFKRLQIVIWANDKSSVKAILKKHLNGRPFSINRITEEVVNNAQN